MPRALWLPECLPSTIGRCVLTACSNKTPLFPGHNISEGLPATQRGGREFHLPPPLRGVTTWPRMKAEEPTLGRKGFLPFKFLNFSRSVEVQTTEPRKLKRKATKEMTNQKSPLHWTAPAVLISLGAGMGWMESGTSASSNKVNTWYQGVYTICKGVDWLLAKLSSSFQAVSLLASFLCGGRDLGVFFVYDYGAFGIAMVTVRAPVYTHAPMSPLSLNWEPYLPTHHTSPLLHSSGPHSITNFIEGIRVSQGSLGCMKQTLTSN